ncbi:MAG: GGDEF domain-containing protein [Desulfobulbaceae bacterium]|nr:GGDEF domain-containing protein [Desulfobulbaceae bacterium]HIJ78697.1 GGDEF domain-containing protein [Deltaproteobacteria bacterium]
MHAAISLIDNRDKNRLDLDRLIVELEHYRRQSEWLQQVNELHARLAGATDLQGMIEAFSVWLMPLVAHDLIAYRSFDHSRSHVICSCHGPDRRLVMQVANDVFLENECHNNDSCFSCGPFSVQQWPLEFAGHQGCIMLLRRGELISHEEAQILDNAVKILGEPMLRALNYEDLFHQARRDMLTGLENRRVFEERIGPLLESAKRYGHPISILSMDLDHFKQINDTLGHAAGDQALRKVAGAMAGMVRNTDLLVRMGGDEFMLVLPDTSADSAKIMADRLCRAVDELAIASGEGKRLGVSIGLVQWQAGVSLDEWLLRADEVLYQAKKSGRNKVCME